MLENQQKGSGGPQNPGAPCNVQVNYSTGGAGISGLKAQLVADARTNRIVIVTRPQNMGQLRTLIQAFDQPNLADKPLEYKLRYVAAGDVLPVLKDLLSEEPQQGGQGETGGTGQGQQRQNQQQRSVNLSSNTSGGTGTGSSSYAGGYIPYILHRRGGQPGGAEPPPEANRETRAASP